jgi:hypothetical protein
LIIVGGVLSIDGVAAPIQYVLRDGLLAGQVGKLVEIFLDVFSRARQGVERWGSVDCGDLTGRDLGGAIPAGRRECGYERHGAPPFPPSRDSGTFGCE